MSVKDRQTEKADLLRRLQEAEDTVRAIRDEIEEAKSEVALMSPRLQKLHFLAWVCRARACAEQRPGNNDVRLAVGRVATILGQLAKIYWPGSVPALRLEASPVDVLQVLARRTSVPRGWSEAADMTEVDIAWEATRDDVDEYGWSDASHLAPATRTPSAVLAEAQAAVEATLDDVLAHRYRSGAHPSAVLGATLSIIVDHGVPVFFCGDRQLACRFVEGLLCRYHRKVQG